MKGVVLNLPDWAQDSHRTKEQTFLIQYMKDLARRTAKDLNTNFSTEYMPSITITFE